MTKLVWLTSGENLWLRNRLDVITDEHVDLKVWNRVSAAHDNLFDLVTDNIALVLLFGFY